MAVDSAPSVCASNHNEIPSADDRKCWDQWGTRSYTVMPHVSAESKKIAEAYRLRPSDVVVLSFPKTGTTWTQTVCEQLRTNAEGYEGFDDITERQPWLEFAYDCGQDLNQETYGIVFPQEPSIDNSTIAITAEGTLEITDPPSPMGLILKPRIFKSHQLLSAINPGAKYLCIVRDPASTLLSWFDFQKAKGRPGYAEYEDVNEYIAHRPELFSGNHIFGTNLWEMYAEVWSARNDPSVKTLVYEGLIADATNRYMDHLPIISNFLGCPEGNDNEAAGTSSRKNLYERVAVLVSRAEMMKHVNRFDDHFIAEMGKKHGRALKIMEPAPKVRSKGNRTEPSEATLEWLEDQWLEKMTPKTGHATYDEFAADLSELLFAEAADDTEGGDFAATAETTTESRETSKPTAQARKSSIVIRRKSSLVIHQMPGIRRRRESLAPHE